VQSATLPHYECLWARLYLMDRATSPVSRSPSRAWMFLLSMQGLGHESRPEMPQKRDVCPCFRLLFTPP
jgi:hypothetical protein